RRTTVLRFSEFAKLFERGDQITRVCGCKSNVVLELCSADHRSMAYIGEIDSRTLAKEFSIRAGHFAQRLRSSSRKEQDIGPLGRKRCSRRGRRLSDKNMCVRAAKTERVDTRNAHLFSSSPRHRLGRNGKAVIGPVDRGVELL